MSKHISFEYDDYETSIDIRVGERDEDYPYIPLEEIDLKKRLLETIRFILDHGNHHFAVKFWEGETLINFESILFSVEYSHIWGAIKNVNTEATAIYGYNLGDGSEASFYGNFDESDLEKAIDVFYRVITGVGETVPVSFVEYKS